MPSIPVRAQCGMRSVMTDGAFAPPLCGENRTRGDSDDSCRNQRKRIPLADEKRNVRMARIYHNKGSPCQRDAIAQWKSSYCTANICDELGQILQIGGPVGSQFSQERHLLAIGGRFLIPVRNSKS